MAGLRQALRVLLEASAPRQGEMNAVRMFAGPLAKTADHEALARAQSLASSGAPREQIWNDTGWYRGPDDNWRFEIDDSAASVAGNGNHYGKLDDVLEHDAIYAAYPQLRDVQAESHGAMRASGQYQRAREVPMGWGGKDGTRTDPARVMINGPNVGSRRSTALHEAQHAVQDIEGFARGGTPSSFWDADQMVVLRDMKDRLARTPAGPEREALRQEFRALQKKIADAGTASYRRLAGEVESRNVQKRRNLTASQRRKRPPWASQDVDDGEQIVRLNGDTATSTLGDALRVSAGLGAAGLAGSITLRELLRNNMQERG